MQKVFIFLNQTASLLHIPARDVAGQVRSVSTFSMVRRGLFRFPEPTPQWIEWTGTRPCGSISLLKAVRNQKVAMLPPFDIFKVESSGLRWMEVAGELERPQGPGKVLGAASPGADMILHQKQRRKSLSKP